MPKRIRNQYDGTWLPTPPYRCATPLSDISLVFSPPLNAANAFASMPKMRAVASNLSEYDPSSPFLRLAKATPPTMMGRQQILLKDGALA